MAHRLEWMGLKSIYPFLGQLHGGYMIEALRFEGD